MKDFTKTALIVSLVLLAVAINHLASQFDLGAAWGLVSEALPWIAFGLLFFCIRGSCCFSRSCSPRSTP